MAVGRPAPWFVAASTTNPNFYFDTIAGRYVVLCFLKSSHDPASQKVLGDLAIYREFFDDKFCCFLGVSTDPADKFLSRLKGQLPGIDFFWDFEQKVSRLFGVVDRDDTYHLCTYIFDERLRVLAVVPFADAPENHVTQLVDFLSQLPKLDARGMAAVQAPVLVVPRVFETGLCQALISYYKQHGGEESGFMRDEKGVTVPIVDRSFKRRRDCAIEDEDLRNAAMFRIHDLLVPEIYKAFQFKATRIERHMVACYDSESGGFFKAHRDNTTKGTAHRKFAVSLNLNTGEYEGGLLKFPEFGYQTHTAPAGGAIVFSCSLLHEATPVTKGRRYAYLPFLYDDSAAKIREVNREFLGPETR
nr:2OG-Fe(II) oxygenase [Pseudanabaena sp. PCC 6802]